MEVAILVALLTLNLPVPFVKSMYLIMYPVYLALKLIHIFIAAIVLSIITLSILMVVSASTAIKQILLSHALFAKIMDLLMLLNVCLVAFFQMLWIVVAVLVTIL